MGTRWDSLAAIFLAACSWQCLAAGAADTLNKTDARSLPPEAVTQQISKELQGILVPMPLIPLNSPPQHALETLAYWTKPVGTGVSGLCRADAVYFEFQAVNGYDAGPRTPVRLTGLSANSNFHFLTPPAAFTNGGMTVWDRKALNEDCRHLVPDAMTFYQAPNEYTAWQGQVVFRAIGRATESGKMPSLFKCSAQTDVEECTKLLFRLKSATLRSVETCNTFGAAQNGACLVLWTEWVGLTVYFDEPSENPKILHIDARQPYVVDEPQD